MHVYYTEGVETWGKQAMCNKFDAAQQREAKRIQLAILNLKQSAELFKLTTIIPPLNYALQEAAEIAVPGSGLNPALRELRRQDQKSKLF